MPEVDQATIDLEIDFVEMPRHMRLRPAFAKIGRDHGSKMVQPSRCKISPALTLQGVGRADVA
jgi:hypothetical protein